MRIATIHGRVALIDGTGSGAVDVETASGGRFLTSYIEGIGEMRHRFVANGPRGRDANSDPEEER